MNASPLSPPLTPISGWVNPPPCLHECCNFTCLVSYHLDFHQLDLGSLTGLQNCWHPAPRFIVSCEWLVNDVTSQSTTRGCTEWSAVTHRSTNCARCCLTSVIWREPLSLLCHATTCDVFANHPTGEYFFYIAILSYSPDQNFMETPYHNPYHYSKILEKWFFHLM